MLRVLFSTASRTAEANFKNMKVLDAMVAEKYQNFISIINQFHKLLFLQVSLTRPLPIQRKEIM
jgi:uncharacterized protein YfbU (UPF0304 family)